jgi:hypothetical protein
VANIPLGFRGGTLGERNMPGLQQGGGWSATLTISEVDKNNVPISFDATGCVATLYFYKQSHTESGAVAIVGTWSTLIGSPIVTFDLTYLQTSNLYTYGGGISGSSPSYQLWIVDATGAPNCYCTGTAPVFALP